MRSIGIGTFTATDEMRDNIDRVLESGRISYGHFSKTFEQQFARLHGRKYGILSNSGTSSLQVALQAMKEIHGWPDFSEVILPATTFISTANIIQHCKLIPFFVDIDRDTYNINIFQAVAALAPETKAIIGVNLFGQSANYRDLIDLLERNDRRDIKIIEDSCETMFATHQSNPVGSWGDIACFSMYVAHLLVAGVGGLSITDNPEYAAKMRSLVNHGLSIDNLEPDDNFSPRPMVGRRFVFDSVGHSFRITEFEAAIALAQLENYTEMIAKRNANAALYSLELGTVNYDYGDVIQLPRVAQGNTHSWMMYPIVLNQNTKSGAYEDKEPLMKWLNERGIETRDMLPILGQPVYNWLDAADFPVSDWLVKSGFYIGCHQDLDHEDIIYTADCIRQYFDKRKNS